MVAEADVACCASCASKGGGVNLLRSDVKLRIYAQDKRGRRDLSRTQGCREGESGSDLTRIRPCIRLLTEAVQLWLCLDSRLAIPTPERPLNQS